MTKLIALRLDNELIAKIREAQKKMQNKSQLRVTLSDIIRILIRSGLENLK